MKTEDDTSRLRRSRRTYSCGPCKRYKMKCNLHLPCGSCVATGRQAECGEDPPNPPTDEEKMKIAQRRSRNSRRRDSVSGTLKLSLQHNSPGLGVPASAHGSSEQGSMHGSPELSTLSDSRRETVVLLHSPAQKPPRPRSHIGVNIHSLQFLRTYKEDSKAVQMSIPRPQVSRWQVMISSVDANAVPVWFAKHTLIENGGFQELCDLPSCYTVACHMVTRFRSLRGPVAIDKHSLQNMSLACAVFACGKLMDNTACASAVDAWLDMAVEIRDLLGAALDLGDNLYRATLLAICTTIYVAQGRLHLFEAEYRSLFELAVIQPKILQYLHPDYNRHDEHFLALARMWVYLKLMEVEIAVLHSVSSLQFRWPELSNTIQPDTMLIQKIFGLNFDIPTVDFSSFNISLLVLSMFFRRFEHATSAREAIYLYLTLYGNLTLKIQPAVESTVALLADYIDPVTVREYASVIAAHQKLQMFCVRFLSIVRVDGPHFPSLRVAHYTSLMMTMFNLFNDLDDRLAIYPGYITEIMLEGSDLHTIMDTYYALAYQSLFLAVIGKFRAISYNSVVDWGYVFDVVHASNAKTSAKLRVVQPFCNFPMVKSSLAGSSVLVKIAFDKTQPASAEEFTDHIHNSMVPSVWTTFVGSLFGTLENATNYIAQLWRFAEYVQQNGLVPIHITASLRLDTQFLRAYETCHNSFSYSPQLVDEYLTAVVDKEPTPPPHPTTQITW